MPDLAAALAHRPAAPFAVLPVAHRGGAQAVVLPFVAKAALDRPAVTLRNDESELCARFVAGDRQAFAELVQRHQRVVFYVARRYVKNDDDAQDIAQNAFVRAWRNAASFRGEASFRTWVLRIASNLALNHARDRGRWRSDELDAESADHAPLAPDMLADAESSERLRTAISTLPAKQRMVVELRVQDGMSFAEVAAAIDSNEDAAKANFHHALKKLRTILGGLLN